MPSKKKKYNARFPAGRIKKIMQTDEEVGKVALAVPIIISRTLELFVESLLRKAMQITNAKNAKTLSPSHMKQCILSESRFDFLKELVEKIPDVSAAEEIYEPSIMKDEILGTEQSSQQQTSVNTHVEVNSGNRKSHNRLSVGNNGTAHSVNSVVDLSTTNRKRSITEVPHSSTGPNFYKELSTSPSVPTSSVIQYSPKVPIVKNVSNITNHTPTKLVKLGTSTENVLNSSGESVSLQPVYHLDLSQTTSFGKTDENTATVNQPVFHLDLSKYNSQNPPPLVPITDGNQVHPLYSAKFGINSTNEELDEDYDN